MKARSDQASHSKHWHWEDSGQTEKRQIILLLLVRVPSTTLQRWQRTPDVTAAASVTGSCRHCSSISNHSPKNRHQEGGQRWRGNGRNSAWLGDCSLQSGCQVTHHIVTHLPQSTKGKGATSSPSSTSYPSVGWQAVQGAEKCVLEQKTWDPVLAVH